ncbi:hypothetical protein HYDPIDRAFT_166273 [Hydnomerulius pinastri MD-312]|nr:hypothetical protein HYDPIDRAFT_166273 [Hydnomerulius pinastri MD-312]
MASAASNFSVNDSLPMDAADQDPPPQSPSPSPSLASADERDDSGAVVTGVLLLPVTSQTFECDPEDDVLGVVEQHRKELFTALKRTFELPEDPKFSGVSIYQRKYPPDRLNNARHATHIMIFTFLVANMDNTKKLSTTRLSDLKADDRGKSFLVSFPLKGYDNFFGDLVTKHKENIARATAGALINEEASKQASGSKKKSKKRSKAAQDAPAATSPSTGDSGTSQLNMQEILSQFQALSCKVDQFARDNARLIDDNKCHRDDNARLRDDNASLGDDIASLRDDNRLLKDDIASLRDDNRILKDRVAVLECTVKAHEKTLKALRRRIVLDQARDKLAEKYHLSLSDHKPSDLVLLASARLDSKDAALLRKEALNMIFSHSVIREGGNIAAHEASKEELSYAVLDADLTPLQRELLEKIYTFTHDAVPLLYNANELVTSSQLGVLTPAISRSTEASKDFDWEYLEQDLETQQQYKVTKGHTDMLTFM